MTAILSFLLDPECTEITFSAGMTYDRELSFEQIV